MSTVTLDLILGQRGQSKSDGPARLVLITIAYIADDRGFASARVADLAKGAGIHRSTVHRNLDQLISLGELRMFTRGHYQPPCYVVTLGDDIPGDDEIDVKLMWLDTHATWEERIIS